MSSMGTISLPVGEWQALLDQRRAAENEAAALRAQLQEAIVTDKDGAVKQLLEALSASREVIRFAIANYPPEAVRGWPYKELRNFADLLEKAPGVPYDYIEMAIELRTFAAEAQSLEEKRELARIAQKNRAMDKAEGITEVMADQTFSDS